MLVIQHNCGQEYESTIVSLETDISIVVGIICLQEPIIGNTNIIYSAFHFYWPARSKTQARVLTVVKKKACQWDYSKK